MGKTKPTVLIADRYELLRQGARYVLTKGKLRVIAEATTGREAVTLAKKFRPSVVILDIFLSRLNGIEAAREIRKILPAVHIIFLTDATEDHHIQNALRVGAVGYVLKSDHISVLPKAVRTVHEGGLHYSPYVAQRIKKTSKMTASEKDKDPTGLTPREIQIVQLIAEGCFSKEIAAELGLSIKTVDAHRVRIMDKLGMRDIASITHFAIRAGITRQ